MPFVHQDDVLPHEEITSSYHNASRDNDDALKTLCDNLANGTGIADASILPRHLADGVLPIIQGGDLPITYYPSSNTSTVTITFPTPFTSIPKVSVTPKTVNASSGGVFGEIYTVSIRSVSTTGIVIAPRTNYAGNVVAQITWLAIGN